MDVLSCVENTCINGRPSSRCILSNIISQDDSKCHPLFCKILMGLGTHITGEYCFGHDFYFKLDGVVKMSSSLDPVFAYKKATRTFVVKFTIK
ncbi:hypothetical protein CEXT_20851 [Caerostris extrusa]|uniref:Uncharacterized protein n=1 Tax=Caerostris extrusa TaxID=172846 RepID=A0AAV4MMZ2_CAEEX|nr:hypothetical protein CEXT_20851 [Caerostris extrusa]